MSTPTYEPTVFTDLTREEIVAVLNGGAPPNGAHPLSAAELNRLGQALQVLSQNLLSLEGTAQTASQVQQVATSRAQQVLADFIGAAPSALDTWPEVVAMLQSLASTDTGVAGQLTSLTQAITAKYTKPSGGIPLTDLVRADLDGTYAQLNPSASVTRNGAGQVTSVVEGPATITLTRDASGRIASFTTTTVAGATTRTITRSASGQIVSVA